MKRKVQLNNFIQQKNEKSFSLFRQTSKVGSFHEFKKNCKTSVNYEVFPTGIILNADDIFQKFAFQCCDAVEKTEPRCLHKKFVKLQHLIQPHYHLTSFSLFSLICSIFTSFLQCIECRSIFAIWRIEAYLSKMNFPPGFQFPKLFHCSPFQYSDVEEMMALIWHRQEMVPL